jgi:hypothetical protein
VCLECIKRSTSCYYATRSAETQGQALKRKYDELHAENEAYAELFNLIKTRPDDESHEILRRIKMGTDVKDVLRRIKEADLLMQLNTSSNNNSNNSSSSSSSSSNPKPEIKHRYTLPLMSGIPAHLLNPDTEYYALVSSEAAGQSNGASAADC